MINRAGLSENDYDPCPPPPEHLEGPATDEKRARSLHQMATIRRHYLRARQIRFDYSVALPDATFDPHALLPDYFIEAVDNDSSRGRKDAAFLYTELSETITDARTRRPLDTVTFTDVLTYSFIADTEDYAVKDKLLSVNKGRIDRVYGLSEANNKCRTGKDPDLRDWQQITVNNAVQNTHFIRAGTTEIDFGDVNQQSSLLAASMANEIAFTENINCIHRPSITCRRLPRQLYYAATSEALAERSSPHDWTVPATQTRDVVSCLNILALAHWAQNGETLFSNAQLRAAAIMAERDHRDPFVPKPFQKKR